MQMCANAKLFLDVIAASGEPKLWELGPVKAREKVLELTRIVECHETVGEVENAALPGPAGHIPIRVYTPTAVNKDLSGGVIFFHGGAWVLGNLDTHDPSRSDE
jgi:acetyl esterase